MQKPTPIAEDSQPKRAKGRSLDDFFCTEGKEKHHLWPAEEKLLNKAATGAPWEIAETLPTEEATDSYSVRGSFLRFLLLGGDDKAPVHEKGIDVSGAVVIGDIDLDSAKVARPLRLTSCCIRGRLIGRNAELGPLILTGSHILGIDCRGARVKGDVLLNKGFRANSEVNFSSAEIDCELNCEGGEFRNPRDCALNCYRARVKGDVKLGNRFRANGKVNFSFAEIDCELNCGRGEFINGEGGVIRDPLDPFDSALNCYGARVKGDVKLDDDFTAMGGVNLSNAEIGCWLKCEKGKFTKRGGIALNCDRLKVAGTVMLCNGFKAEGEVRLAGAEIGGDLHWGGGSFTTYKEIKDSDGSKRAAFAINMTIAKIQGRLWLAPRPSTPCEPPITIEGSVNLHDAHVAAVVMQNASSWPVPNVKIEQVGQRACVLGLDGFTYDQLVIFEPFDAKQLVNWLQRQPPAHLKENFRPQPFEQLTKVLRAMGHDKDARDIAMKKQHLLQQQQVARAEWRWCWKGLVRTGGFLRRWGTGYYYRPWWLFWWLIALWFGCAVAYQFAECNHKFAPADAAVWVDKDIRSKCAPNWTCKEVSDIINFNAFVYSADVLVPVVDLKQRSSWTALPGWPLYLIWVENFLGSLGILLLGAILSGIVKRD